jgi:Family of unknown function (DUF5681)
MNRKKATASNYRKPPEEHQFRKGESGNPNGRPPKKKAVQPGLSALGGGLENRLMRMVLEEATRPITVREGDKAFEIPAAQAVLRTMFRTAAKGDPKAARQLFELMDRAESGRASDALAMVEFAIQYKEAWGPIFERDERAGLDPPDKFPHPDDIIFDDTTGEFTIDGPLTKKQAGAQIAFRQLALKMMPRFFEVEAALKQQPKNTKLRREYKELKKYPEFLQKDAERNSRLEALRLAQALETEPAEPDTADPGSEQEDAEPNTPNRRLGYENAGPNMPNYPRLEYGNAEPDGANAGAGQENAEPNTSNPGSEHDNQAG